MSTPATAWPFFLPFLGRSRTWPMLASTLKPPPRYLLMVLALDGDSTMTRLGPPGVPFSWGALLARGFRAGGAALGAAAFFRGRAAGAGASAGCFLRAGTGRSWLLLCSAAFPLKSPFWDGAAIHPYYTVSRQVKVGR